MQSYLSVQHTGMHSLGKVCDVTVLVHGAGLHYAARKLLLQPVHRTQRCLRLHPVALGTVHSNTAVEIVLHRYTLVLNVRWQSRARTTVGAL